jgi:hypothetical protein
MPDKLCSGTRLARGSGLISDVNSQQQKTETDNSQCEFLVSLAGVHIRINRHPPQQAAPDVTSIKLSSPNPTSEILPAIRPMTTAAKPSMEFQAMVKYSSLRPRRMTLGFARHRPYREHERRVGNEMHGRGAVEKERASPAWICSNPAHDGRLTSTASTCSTALPARR